MTVLSSSLLSMRYALSARAWIRQALATFCLGIAVSAVAATPANPNKVLRLAFPTQETGFDPARVGDLYSNTVISAIMTPLVRYDWLANPARVVPNVIEAMPELSKDRREYTFRIKPGFFYAPDPAFKGQKRELRAEDFVYGFKRHADPRSRSPQFADMADRIVGFRKAHEEAVANGGKFDYAKPIEGLQAVDQFTLKIRLNEPDTNFLYLISSAYFSGVAQEVVDHYGFENMMAHPVGAGPYRLQEWVRGSKIVLTANPYYPGFVWNFEASPGQDQDKKIAEQMRGRRMPQIGRVEISIIEEPQSLWLAFNSGALDVLGVPTPFISQALTPKNELKPDFVARGVQMYRAKEADIRFQFFNLRDPVIGGYSKEKIALRRAIIMAFDVDEEIRTIRQGQAVRAEQLVSSVGRGHDPQYRSLNRFDPALSNALLDQFGYKRGRDGWRHNPDGSPLIFTIYSSTSTLDRERDELWKKSMDRIGIRLQIKKDRFPEMLKQGKMCGISSWGLGWTGGFDAEYAMKILFSGAIGQNNYACFESEEYDRLFRLIRRIDDGPERMRAIRNMLRLVETNGAMLLSASTVSTRISQPWVVGYRRNTFVLSDWMYLDIDLDKKPKTSGASK